MDPLQRLWLEVGFEALHNAGNTRSSLMSSATAVYIGLDNSDRAYVPTADAGPYQAAGSARSMIAGRTSYIFGLRGQGSVVDTACSSSLVALDYGASGLRRGRCEAALVGGVGLMLSEKSIVALCQATMLSPVCAKF